MRSRNILHIKVHSFTHHLISGPGNQQVLILPLEDDGTKNASFICNRFLDHFKRIDPHKSIIDVIMFDGASNVQLSGELLQIRYPKITVMRGVEHTVSLFFNDISKIPVVNQMIRDHKAIYNLFGSGIYHKPHSIFKSKSYESTIVTLDYSVEMIPGWLGLSLEYT